MNLNNICDRTKVVRRAELQKLLIDVPIVRDKHRNIDYVFRPILSSAP